MGTLQSVECHPAGLVHVKISSDRHQILWCGRTFNSVHKTVFIFFGNRKKKFLLGVQTFGIFFFRKGQCCSLHFYPKSVLENIFPGLKWKLTRTIRCFLKIRSQKHAQLFLEAPDWRVYFKKVDFLGFLLLGWVEVGQVGYHSIEQLKAYHNICRLYMFCFSCFWL